MMWRYTSRIKSTGRMIEKLWGTTQSTKELLLVSDLDNKASSLHLLMLKINTGGRAVL